MKYCDYWGFERALASYVMNTEYGWPVLSIDRVYNNGYSGQLRTRVQAFVEKPGDQEDPERKGCQVMGKVKYPNPKFFKAKDRMDWAAQAENLKLVGGIFWDMFKETDWKKFGEGWKNILISDRDRIKEEYKAFAAASMKDKIDLILNGERHLGRLYRDGAMCTVRREWRGIKDTVYDFYEWARHVGHAAHVLLQGPDPGSEPDAVLSLDGVLLLLPQLHG